MSKAYIVKPKYKKSSFSNEYWTNIINNKSVTLKVTDDGCERFIEILNENEYTEGELNLIYNSMYEDIDEEYFDETFMEENGWDLSDTTYEISGGVELEEDI